MSVNSRGDTLVEVMIALAIVSSVLAISLSTASRSLNVGRAAQERTEALKFAEGQVEGLKLLGQLGGDARTQIYDSRYSRTSGTPQTFCLSVSGSPSVVPQSMVEQLLEDDELTIGGPPNIYASGCAVGVDQRYKLSIERTDSGVSPNITSTFMIRARWERLGGGKDEVSIAYRMHQGQF